MEEKEGCAERGRVGAIWKETSKEKAMPGFRIDGLPPEMPQAAAWMGDVMQLDESEQLDKLAERGVVAKEPSPLGLTLRKTPSLLDFISYRLCGGKNGLRGDKNGLRGDASTVPAVEGSIKALGRSKSAKIGSVTSGVSMQIADNKLKASNFPASSLKIGKWERVSRYEGDLVSKCYYAKRKLVWEVLENGLKSKIEIQWSDICGLKASCPEDLIGMLEIEVSRAPLFFCETNPQPRKHTLWQATTDFTCGEATICRHHSLTFPEGVLTKHYEKLLQCDPRLKSLVEGISALGLRGAHNLLAGVAPTYQGPQSVHNLREPERQRQRHSPCKLPDAQHEVNKAKGSDECNNMLVTYSESLYANTVVPTMTQSSAETTFPALRCISENCTGTTVEQQQLASSDSWNPDVEIRQGDRMVNRMSRMLSESEKWEQQEGSDKPAAKLEAKKGWEEESALLGESPCAGVEREIDKHMLSPGKQSRIATSNFMQSISMPGVNQISSATKGRAYVLEIADRVYGGLDPLPTIHLQTCHSVEQGRPNSVKNPFGEEGCHSIKDTCITEADVLETLMAPDDGPHRQFHHSTSPSSSSSLASSRDSFCSDPPPLHQPVLSQQLVLRAQTAFLGQPPSNMFTAQHHPSLYSVTPSQVFSLFGGVSPEIGDVNSSAPVLPARLCLPQPPDVEMAAIEHHHNIDVTSFVESHNLQILQSHTHTHMAHGSEPTTLVMSGCSILPMTAMSGTLPQALGPLPFSEDSQLGRMEEQRGVASSPWKASLTKGSTAELGSVPSSALCSVPGPVPGLVPVPSPSPGSALGSTPDSIAHSIPHSVPCQGSAPAPVPGSISGSVLGSVPGSVLKSGSSPAAVPATLWGAHSFHRDCVPELTDTSDFMFDFLPPDETMTESAPMDSILEEEEDYMAAVDEILDDDDEVLDSMTRIPSTGDVLLHNVPRVASVPQFFIRDKESGVLCSSQREIQALIARS